MQKAGGIIALIAGIFALFAAFATIFMGGLASVFNSDGAGVVVYLGWGGVIFSFLSIILGAVAISAKGKVPGILLIICSIFGAILGGTLVALFMGLTFIGGVLALIGRKPNEINISDVMVNRTVPVSSQQASIFHNPINLLGLFIIFIICGLAFLAYLKLGNQDQQNILTATNQNLSISNPPKIANIEPHPQHKYVFNSTESSIINMLLDDDIRGFTSNGDTLISRTLIKASSLQISTSYQENEVAADQKYKGKLLHITGKIMSINSGFGDEPFLVLDGANFFSGPQAHFNKNQLDRIAKLKKKNVEKFVCTGGGEIAGTAMLNNCMFTDDYAKDEKNRMLDRVTQVLNGQKIPLQNERITTALIISSIAIARDPSSMKACATELDSKECREATDIIFRNKEKFFKPVINELREKGVDASNLPDSFL